MEMHHQNLEEKSAEVIPHSVTNLTSTEYLQSPASLMTRSKLHGFSFSTCSYSPTQIQTDQMLVRLELFSFLPIIFFIVLLVLVYFWGFLIWNWKFPQQQHPSFSKVFSSYNPNFTNILQADFLSAYFMLDFACKGQNHVNTYSHN